MDRNGFFDHGGVIVSRVADGKTVFRPVTRAGEWSGQIFLPARESRSENTIFVKIATAPQSHQEAIGKLLRMSWLRGKGAATQYTPNIRFNPKELEEAKKAGNLVPVALDGWDSVGPLESLAAARCRGSFGTASIGGKSVKLCDYSRIDRIFVKFTPTVFHPTRDLVEVGQEPTVVAGTHYALAKNIVATGRDADNKRLKMYAANPFQNGSFDSSSTIEFGVEEDFGTRPNFTFNKINQSPAAKDGWYLYADVEESGGARFVLRAIEPRSLVRVAGAYGKIAGTENGKQFLAYQDNIPPSNSYLSKTGITRGAFASLENNFRKVMVVPGASGSPLSDQNPVAPVNLDNGQKVFQAGETGLVVHLFHWITDSAGKRDVGPLGLVTGHYSYGFYEVFQEPIANELQFDVVYRQVYGQGGDAVISSRISRSEYMGSLRRGWSNSIATSDVLVRAPWLDNVLHAGSGAGSQLISPAEVFDDSLSLMLHAYRTGSGDGISSIVPWASCVQDSSQALFIAIHRLEKMLVQSRGADYCRHPQFGRFCGLAKDLKAQFDSSDVFANIPMRGDWLNNAETLQISRTNDQVSNGYEALQSYKTVLPRNAFNLFLGVMLDLGANLLLMENVQIGGYWSAQQKSSQFVPVPATTIVEVVKAKMAEMGVASQTLTTEQFVQFVLKQEGVRSLSDLNSRLPAK